MGDSNEVAAKPLSKTTILLLSLLGLALILRVWGIWFGLPHVFHNDEGFEILRALRLGTGDYDFTRIGKGGYFYLLFVEYGVLFAALFGLGIVESPTEFGEYYVRDPSAFYLIGRATTAVIGTITVYLVYRIGCIAYSTRVALIAAAFLTVNVLHAYLSHLTTVDVPMTCLAMASLYFGVRIAQNGETRDYWWAALFAAMATSTKLPAILLLVPLVIAHFYNAKTNYRGFGGFLLSKLLWQSAAIFVVAYIVASPGILFHFDQVVLGTLDEFVGQSELGADNGLEEGESSISQLPPNLFVYYWNVLIDSMTLPVFVVCLVGLGYALWSRRPADIVLASFPILMYVAMSSSSDHHHYFPRYIVPAVPVLAIFGARIVDEAVNMFARKRSEVLALVVTMGLIILPAYEIAASNWVMGNKDTRTIAREWVDLNVEEGASIFIEGYRTTVYKGSVPLQNSAENIKASIEYFRDTEPGKAKYFKMALKTLSGKTYDLVTVWAEELRDLQYYKDSGVEYFVLRPDRYTGDRLRKHWPNFVDEIRSDSDIILVGRFEPDPKQTPGPLIEIYRVLPESGD